MGQMMALETEDMHYSLPMSQICPNSPNAKILDCFLSNYQIEQELKHVIQFTSLEKDEVVQGIRLLVEVKLIEKTPKGYITNFKSDRMVGLYSYYRATLGSNLANMFV